MTENKRRNYLSWWIATAVMVSIAVVFGHALDNLGQVPLWDLARPLILLSLVSILLVLITAKTAPSYVGAIPIGCYLFFTYLFFSQQFFGLPFRGYLTLAVLFFILLLLTYALRRLDSGIAARTSLLVASVMALAPVAVGVSRIEFGYEAPAIAPQFEAAASAVAAAKRPVLENLPDIIYVVPDRYPSSRTLLNEFGFDNHQFYAELRKRGFLVVENAVANYPKTFMSLASTQNAGYLDKFSSLFEQGSVDETPVTKAIANNFAQDFLRKLGYEFVNFGNFWSPTRNNIHANENFLGYASNDPAQYLTEFESSLLSKTAMPVALQKFGISRTGDCVRMKNQLKRLESIGNNEKPQFVFVHILIPHNPIVMNSIGECIQPMSYSPELDNWEEFKRAFAGYVVYFNTAILEIFEEQKRNRVGQGRPLIFVIQSDEGPFPRPLRRGERNFMQFSDQELAMKMGILNAVFIDGARGASSEMVRSPVNNWRVILGAVLEHDFLLLDHRAHIYPSDDLYKFCDVSGRLGLHPPHEEGCIRD